MQSLSADEWEDWLAWRKLFPSPQTRADINTALMRHSALAPHTKKQIRIADLMLKYGQPKKRAQTAQELAEKARAWCEASNKLAAAGKLQW